MNRSILLFILIFAPLFLSAQSDTDKNQQWIFTYLYCQELDKAKHLIDTQFLHSKDKSKQVIGYSFLAGYYYLAEDEAKQLQALHSAKKLAEETGKEIDLAYVEYAYAQYYSLVKSNRHDLFTKSLNHSIEIFKKYPNETRRLANLYILKVYYANEKYPAERLNYSDYSIYNDYAKKTKSNQLISLGYLMTSIFYYSDKDSLNLNLSDSYIQKSHQYAHLIEYPNEKKKTLCNIYYIYGILMLQKKDYAKAHDLFNVGLTYSDGYAESSLFKFVLYLGIGGSYENREQYSLAKDYYLKAYNLRNNKKITERVKIANAESLSRIYKKMHQYDKAVEYLEDAKKLIQQENLKNTQSLEAFYKNEHEMYTLEEKNKEYEKKKKLFFGIIGLAFVSIIFLLFMIYYRQKMNKQRNNLLEAEKENLKIERELSLLKQEQLQKQALVTSIQLEHKNTFINELKVNIQKDNNMNHLLKEEQMIDSSFSTIRDIIQETHPNFFKRLNERAKSKLTNLDLKYAAYIYMNMDNTQIAKALKVDPKTVSVTKYRLKQKLNIDKEEDLNTFIRNLNI